MSGESLESLLEFLTISGRVAVVQLEPPRARAFAAALRLAMEFRDAAREKVRAEEREACALLVGDYVDLASDNRVRTDFAKAIRARGGPVAHEGSPSLVEAGE